MSEHSVKHHTFTTERTYPVPVSTVFQAWSDPVAKARWFGGEGNEHSLDFQVGGTERVTVHRDDHDPIRLESRYADIVPEERIVYTSWLFGGDVLSTVSLTTVELIPDGEGTRLVLVEHDTFLDGQEQPGWRETGTNDWLDKLGADLKSSG